MEGVVFNLPYWTGMAASTDSPSTLNTTGSGLVRQASGTLEVTDPTKAYLRTTVDGSSSYARIDLADITGASGGSGDPAIDTVRVRVDCDGRVGRSMLVDASEPRSLYVRADARRTVTVWIQEPAGTRVPFFAVRPNVRVPFSFDWIRVTVMAAIACLVGCWRPGSRLWKVRADPHARVQRVAFIVVMTVIGVCSFAAAGVLAAQARPLVFHTAGGYTYDFDQYGHVADALLHGRLSLDLKVPEAFADSANPYDPALRELLLDRGVSPIYWDYAFYKGHWYSYFGVIPALLLFVPYQAVSALWSRGGAMLPSASAVLVFMFGFLLFASLLMVRVLRRVAPRISLAALGMAWATLLLGSNAGYLWLRTNFYSVPIAASLMLTMLGLWLWTCAQRDVDGPKLWHVGEAPGLSIPYLAAGSACIAANIGCRPTFALSALLIFPMFRSQIRELGRMLRHRRVTRSAWVAPAAVVVPALMVSIPVFVLNTLRFGSPLNFGNRYQITVNDMTSYREPLANIRWIVGYYLFLPARLQSSFPFVAVNPTPLPAWGYAEPMVAGLFVLCPMAWFAIVLPLLRRRHRIAYGHLLHWMAVLGLAIMVMDACTAGLGWRYICDFGWLVAFAALPGLVWFVGDMPGGHGRTPAAGPRTERLCAVSLWLRRTCMMLLIVACVLFLLASCFASGRDDTLQHAAPQMFAQLQSWFALLG
ncbi:glycosyltransferase [Bifidobacterium thermophilum]|uniref:glycosyltransferase n=1 Tax=Bifidobacterium thermophilum TaxID=33905 RepID=UPI0030DA7A2A